MSDFLYPTAGWDAMSIKKELLNELTELQLKQLAESKGIKFNLNKLQQKYYENWNEKDKLVDIMATKKQVTVSEIEKLIQEKRM